jgi:hypothetical protein
MYDGLLGEDDEELPRFLCTITILEDIISGAGSNGSNSKISPQSKQFKFSD